jgi:lysophospholipase L1-like esterase
MEKNGIEFIDIDKEVFKKEIDPLNLFPFRSQNHYNAEGYNKIANAIYKLTR